MQPSSSRTLDRTCSRDEPEDVVRDGHLEVVLLLLLPQDGDPVLEVGEAAVGHHAPLEAAHQAGFEPGKLLGRPVRGDHDLLAGLVERIEGVEELLLGALLALQEVDVVHQQEVHVAPVPPLQLRRGAAVDALDDLVDELLGADEEHPGGRGPLDNGVGDGLHQVGLAQPGGAVDEERVVGLARRLGHGVRRRGRQLVRLPDDEGVEGVALVERLGVPDVRPRRRRFGGGRRHEEVHLGALLAVFLHPEDDPGGAAEERLGQLGQQRRRAWSRSTRPQTGPARR